MRPAVILGNPNSVAGSSGAANRVTIDEIFRRAVARRPDAFALIDPPNRAQFAGGASRRLTYGEADRMVSATAGRLRRMGLQPDSIVGVQLPNTVEGVLTLLGVLRAGLIAAPLPLLWRRAEAVAALEHVDVRALITCARVGAFNHSDLAMHIAAEIFPIRYVCAFGSDLPDGVVPFGDLFDAQMPDPLPVRDGDRVANPAAHVAVLTWDMTVAGPVLIARTHMELIAGGICIMLEGSIANDATILSTCVPCSFAGMSLTVLPWLLSGGTLVLHHPFDPDVLAAQRDEHCCNTIMLPAPLASRLSDAGKLDARDGLQAVIALWRAPERLFASARWRERAVAFIDVQAFGEIGIVAARRLASGQPAPTGFGPVKSPRGAAAAVPVIELVRTHASTVALRGPMVPRHAFPFGAEHGGLPSFQPGPDGLVDTGYTCRTDPDTLAMVVTAPPTGIVSIGGYRCALAPLQQCLAAVDGQATLTALPDSLLGHRLAAGVDDPDAVRSTLAGLGVNPLMVGALRDRRSDHADAA